MFNIGLVSVSFRGNTPLEIANNMKKCKIDTVEWGSDVHAPQNNPEKLKEIVRIQEGMGINPSSYGTYFYIGQNKPDDIKSYIEAAKIIGTDTLRVWCGNKGFKNYSEDDAKHLLCNAKKTVDIAAEQGVTLCTEYHPGTFTDCPEGVIKLKKFVGSDSLKTYWQPNQYISFRENMDEAKRIAHITENIHVFNWDNDKKLPLAFGLKVWSEYLKAFNKSQNLLLEFMPDGRIESLPEEVASLRKLVREL